MDPLHPGNIYRETLASLEKGLQLLEEKRSRLGWLRLAVFILTVVVCQQVFTRYGLYGLLPLITGIGILLFLVSKDADNNRDIRNQKTLIRINREELEVAAYNFTNRFDGAPLLPHLHDYAYDLDLFGQASLFQYLNRSYTEGGQTLLASALLKPLSKNDILERQDAVKELAPLLSWRQQFQAFAMQEKLTLNTQEKVVEWVQEVDHSFGSPVWKWLPNVYSLITIGCLVATIFGILPGPIMSGLYGLFFIISLLFSGRTIKPYITLNGIVPQVAVLRNLLATIESQVFKSVRLKSLAQELEKNGHKASREIHGLRQILDRFDLRLSVVGLLFVNPFMLWDLRQVLSLNKWRARNKNFIAGWYATIAEMEVLQTFAALHFNQPGWTFPIMDERHLTLEGTAIGHPLITADRCVVNDFAMHGVPALALVTGSNMAGKSTFLRSLGVNLVLAQAGAVVCASSFRFSPVRLMSSMRIADNLAENTSTFYAELKKLKSIIEVVQSHEPAFILLDEILRGTNSLDRHTGSAALIAQLISEGATAVLATHDVELARLEENYAPALHNYHFDVQVEGEELYFDYKLKEGVCKSLNASILMKKIGIRL